MNPEDPSFYYNLAISYLILGNTEKALMQQEKLKAIGVKIVTDVDKSGFTAVADPYLDKLAKQNQDSADGQTFRIQFALAQAKLDQALEQALKLTKSHAAFCATCDS